MATSQIKGVRFAGVATAVPSPVKTVEDAALVFGKEDANKISESTGVRVRHVAPLTMCSSDLCYEAADRLLDELQWDRSSVDALVFVSQTPDFLIPATACVLQGRLNLPKSCAAFDVNLGCSGYVYGLWLGATMLAAGGVRRLLLLCGDTARKVSPTDRSVAMLFGDAGTATALECDPASPPMSFVLGTDGHNYQHLIVPAGGFRTPSSAATSERKLRDDGNLRSDEEVHMNGAEIFAFTLREVPPMFQSVLACSGWELDSVDAFVMHQANRFMLRHLAKKMKLPLDKVPLTLDDYGNTSSASIPLTICERLAPRLRSGNLRLLLAGFGVGLSYAAATVECGPLVIPLVVTVDGSTTKAESEIAC